MRTGRRRALCLALATLLLVSGCWDRREIEERSTVLASGIDLCAPGAACQVQVTRQIAIPGRIPLGAGEGGGGGRAETVVVLSVEGDSVPDTTRRAQAELNRTVSFAHTRVLVLGEAFVRQNLLEGYLDYVRRLAEVRRLMWVVVTEGSAKTVIEAKPSLERVPALYLNDMLEDATRTGRLPSMPLGEFLIRLSNKGEDTIAPLLRMSKPDHPDLHGLAVFRGYRMVGKLSPSESATFMELRGIHKAADMLDIPLPRGDRATVLFYGRSARYRLRWEQGRIHAKVRVILEGDMMQLSPRLSSSDPTTLDMVERAAAEEIKQRSAALVQKLQTEFHADSLGLGEQVRAHMPAVWHSIPDWRTAFVDAQFEFDVRVHVRRAGLSMD